MALYQDLDFRQGSLNSRMGAIGTPTNITWKRDLKGNAIETGSGKYVQYNQQLLPDGAFSVVIFGRIKPTVTTSSNYSSVININNTTGSGVYIADNSVGNPISLYLGGTNWRTFTAIGDKNLHCIIFTIPGAAQSDISSSQCFVDGIAKTPIITTATGAQTARSQFVYTGGGTAANDGANILRIKVYNHVLSTAEINNEQREFNESVLIDPPIRGFTLPVASDLSRLSIANSKQWGGILYSSDFSSGLNTWNSNQGINSMQYAQTINGETNCLKTIIDASNSPHEIIKVSAFVVSTVYKVSYKYFIPASNASLKGIKISTTTSNNLSGNLTILNTWTSGSFEFTAGATPMRIYALNASNNDSFAGNNLDYYAIKDIIIETRSGLLAAWNFLKTGNTLVDISGNGCNGTIDSGIVSSQGGLYFNGGSKKISCTTVNLTGSFTVAGRFKIFGTGGGAGGRVFDSTAVLIIASTTLVISRSGGGSQAGSSAIQTNKWYNFSVTSSSAGVTNMYINGELSGTANQTITVSGSPSTLYIGNDNSGARGFDGIIQDLRIVNRIWTTAEIKSYNNSFIKPTIIERFQYPVTAFPNQWIKGTGSYKISELSADVTSGTLKLKKGTRVLECVSAGTCAIQSNWAFGVIEFGLYKGADGNTLRAYIASDKFASINGYAFNIDSDERVGIGKFVLGTPSWLNFTNFSYVANSTWYKVRITRTTAGVFTVLMKGGALTPTTGYDGWHLVSTSGGSGANPVTDNTYSSSNYLVLDLDSGDRFFDLSCYDGIKQY